MKHPTPWVEAPKLSIKDADGICVVWVGPCGSENDKIIRDRVIHRVNAHDDLVAACKKAKKHLECDLVEPGRTVFWELVAALANAQPDKGAE